MKINITVELDVDLDDYATTYAFDTREGAEDDARAYLPQVVAHLLTVRPDHDRRPGDPLTVGAPDAGVTLTGRLADFVEA